MPRKPSPWLPAIVGSTYYEGQGVGALPPDPQPPPATVGYVPLPADVKIPPGSPEAKRVAGNLYKALGERWGVSSKKIGIRNSERAQAALEEMYPGWPVMGAFGRGRGESGYVPGLNVEPWRESGVVNELARALGMPGDSIKDFHFGPTPPSHLNSGFAGASGSASGDSLWVSSEGNEHPLKTGVHEVFHRFARRIAPDFKDQYPALKARGVGHDQFGQQRGHYPRGVPGDRAVAEMLELKRVKQKTGVDYPVWAKQKYPNLVDLPTHNLQGLYPFLGRDEQTSPYSKK